MSEPKKTRTSRNSELTYASSGVDIDRADEAKEKVKSLARATFNRSVVGDIGSFGGLFRPEFTRYQSPLLVSSVDGVGTKLKIAFMTGVHNTIGIDIVSHCTNDILVQGAHPLFFMDYIATGTLDPQVVAQIVEGLAEGCRQSRCVLLGGETAEMPDFYSEGEYDLAGFVVGILDESKLLGSHRVQQGDILIGLRSSGLHTNGYSLVRKFFFEIEERSTDDHIAEFGQTVGEELLIPHRNYLSVLKELLQSDDLHALAHITGGGIPGNLNRILPTTADAVVERGSWEIPAIFRYIRERGMVEDKEMYRTFNMGLGMILVVAARRADRVQEYLQSHGERYYLIGEIQEGSGKVRLV
jgi:phosphoribosylformylglycinamidine cyclo-ligase